MRRRQGSWQQIHERMIASNGGRARDFDLDF